MSLIEGNDKLTVAEYLAFEAENEVRHEYFGGEIFARSGGTRSHSVIIANMTIAVGVALEGRECQIIDSSLKVRIDAVDA